MSLGLTLTEQLCKARGYNEAHAIPASQLCLLEGHRGFKSPGLELPGRKRERNEIPTVPDGVWESLAGTDHNPPPRLWPPTPKLFRCRRRSSVLTAARRSWPAPGARCPPPLRSGAAPASPSSLRRQRHRPPPFSSTSSYGAQPAALASPTHFLSSIRSSFPRRSSFSGKKEMRRGHRDVAFFFFLFFFFFSLCLCPLEMVRGSHETLARRPRTLGRRRRQRTHRWHSICIALLRRMRRSSQISSKYFWKKIQMSRLLGLRLKSEHVSTGK
ncbi:uncharacterized protein LOC110401848 [Numida meleagris]|uniref:uncharacterized protein LOC110401848 n=1 Tax=Numida meleagris TaxID=8996 RepID=UPI000B3DB828|nr:uncharacterized protein LOC110401848 [Numida meleagris]